MTRTVLTALVALAGCLAASAPAAGPRPEVTTLDGVPLVQLPDGGAPDEPADGPDRAEVLRRYHDSGLYADQLAAVVTPARRWVARVADRPGRPALVLDIDETSLSNYAALEAADFARGARSAGEAIRPTLRLHRLARRQGVAIFFLTGRDAPRRRETVRALRREGFRGWTGLRLEPVGSDVDVETYKARARASIERRGYRIVANVGDQYSDLGGGHAARAFKLPNPFYELR